MLVGVGCWKRRGKYPRGKRTGVYLPPSLMATASDGPAWRPQKDCAMLGVERLGAFCHSGEMETSADRCMRVLAVELQVAVGADPLGSSQFSMVAF